MERTNSPAQDAMSALLVLEPGDLELLLNTAPDEWLGRIMRMNRTPRYHNSLDALNVIHRLVELRNALPGQSATTI